MKIVNPSENNAFACIQIGVRYAIGDGNPATAPTNLMKVTIKCGHKVPNIKGIHPLFKEIFSLCLRTVPANVYDCSANNSEDIGFDQKGC